MNPDSNYTPSTTIAGTGTWKLDPVHSSLSFEIGYLGGTFRGQFRDIEATLVADGGLLSLEGSAPVAGVDVGNEVFAEHLQSADFFDAERHPRLSFAAEWVAHDGNEVDVDGKLTIRGITSLARVAGSASLPIVDPYGKERVTLSLATTIDRTDFGLDWNVEHESGGEALDRKVRIVAELFFVQAA